MNVIVVVEGTDEVAVLRAVLPADILSKCDINPVAGRSAVTSVARTLLVKHHRPVALLFDTDTMDPQAIWDAVQTTEDLLRAVAAGTLFRVIYCTPELEAVFFDSEMNLNRVFPHYDHGFFLKYAKTQPKQALEYLFKNGGGPATLQELLDDLTSNDIERLRSTYPVRHLVEFVIEVQVRYRGRST